MTIARKILIVDDNKKNAERLKFELEHRNACDVADTKPKQAIEDLVVKKLKDEYIAFIVDEFMPRMDTYGFCEQAKHICLLARFILLSEERSRIVGCSSGDGNKFKYDPGR